MKHTQIITINVNGKTIKATVHLDAPGLVADDCLSPQMILSAVANGQNQRYISRHHKDRAASVIVNPLKEADAFVPQALRLVA